MRKKLQRKCKRPNDISMETTIATMDSRVWTRTWTCDWRSFSGMFTCSRTKMCSTLAATVDSWRSQYPNISLRNPSRALTSIQSLSRLRGVTRSVRSECRIQRRTKLSLKVRNIDERNAFPCRFRSAMVTSVLYLNKYKVEKSKRHRTSFRHRRRHKMRRKTIV